MRPKRIICKAEGCDQTAGTRGMCSKHYTRWRRHGDSLAVKEWPLRTIARQKDGSSYVMIRTDGGYKAEHILLAEKALGRPLPQNAVVHHIDRDGMNNNTKSPWNLVVCPDQAYHMILHARARALGYEPLRSCDKLNSAQVSEIFQSKEPRAVLARRYDVSIATIKSIRSGRHKGCLATGREFVGGDLL